MKVRKATLADSAALARVQVNSYRGAYADLMPAEFLTAFSYEEQEQDWKDFIQEERDLLLVAESAEGQVIGYTLARRIADESANFDCEIVALHVSREHHRQGAGRALMAGAALRMAAEGCRSLGLWVLEGNPASGFYERLGGKPNGEHFFEAGELRKRELGYRWERIEDLFS